MDNVAVISDRIDDCPTGLVSVCCMLSLKHFFLNLHQIDRRLPQSGMHDVRSGSQQIAGSTNTRCALRLFHPELGGLGAELTF
jgi:hypothetical protein